MISWTTANERRGNMFFLKKILLWQILLSPGILTYMLCSTRILPFGATSILENAKQVGGNPTKPFFSYVWHDSTCWTWRVCENLYLYILAADLIWGPNIMNATHSCYADRWVLVSLNGDQESSNPSLPFSNPLQGLIGSGFMGPPSWERLLQPPHQQVWNRLLLQLLYGSLCWCNIRYNVAGK